MYYSSEAIRTPKKKIAARVVTADGDIFEGYFFLTGDRRVSDLLNGDTDFLPFETMNGEIYILNRRMMSHIKPHEADARNIGDKAPEKDAALKHIAQKIQNNAA